MIIPLLYIYCQVLPDLPHKFLLRRFDCLTFRLRRFLLQKLLCECLNPDDFVKHLIQRHYRLEVAYDTLYKLRRRKLRYIADSFICRKSLLAEKLLCLGYIAGFETLILLTAKAYSPAFQLFRK